MYDILMGGDRVILMIIATMMYILLAVVIVGATYTVLQIPWIMTRWYMCICVFVVGIGVHLYSIIPLYMASCIISRI